jgi:hypothetical protein
VIDIVVEVEKDVVIETRNHLKAFGKLPMDLILGV